MKRPKSNIFFARSCPPVEHAYFSEAKSQLFSYATFAQEETIIIVVGPSHSGKSSLRVELQNSVHITAEEIRKNPVLQDYSPALFGSASNATNGRYDQHLLLDAMLASGRHPLYCDRGLSDGGYRPRRPTSITTLRKDLVTTCRCRKTRYLIVDEAHHITSIRNPISIGHHLDCLKSIAIDTRTVLVLFADYSLLMKSAAIDFSHFSSRIQVVHLPRYKGTPGGIEGFRAAVAMAAAELPDAFNCSPQWLQDHWELLFALTLGRIGSLYRRLNAAFSSMHARGGRCLSEFDLKAGITNSQLRIVRAEIERGERFMEEGLEIDLGPPPKIATTSSAKPSSRRPGKRNPIRDPVPKNSTGGAS